MKPWRWAALSLNPAKPTPLPGTRKTMAEHFMEEGTVRKRGGLHKGHQLSVLPAPNKAQARVGEWQEGCPSVEKDPRPCHWSQRSSRMCTHSPKTAHPGGEGKGTVQLHDTLRAGPSLAGSTSRCGLSEEE